MSLGDRLYRGVGLLGLWLLVAAGCGSPPVDPAVKEAKDAGHEACNRYIDCILETTPEALPPTLMAYGPEGECWNSEDVQVLDICRKACAQGREGLGELYTDVAACGECETDEHCTDDEQRTRCEPKENRCVTCLVNGDCASGRCHPELNACVVCADDTDCGEGACDPETWSCVGCLTNEHCPDGVCDATAQQCVGCLGDGDCSEGRCDLAAQQCVGCLGEDDCVPLEDCVNQQCVEHDTVCTPGERRCSDANSFEACTDDGLMWEPAGGCAGEKLCDPETATCVDPMICPDGATDCVFESGDIAVYLCYDGGTQIKKSEDCDNKGMSCDAGKCVNTTYGPCSVANDPCAVASDVCTLGAQNDFYCAPKAACATDSDCPPGYPEGADYEPECDAGVCRLRCEPGVCPPGMACRADVPNEGVCVWKY